MIVLRQADVYAPQFAGRQDILIAGGEIVRMAQHLDCGEAEEIDAQLSDSFSHGFRIHS